MNTCNLNTATGGSTQRGGKGTKPFIVQLEEMERAASKALFAWGQGGTVPIWTALNVFTA